MTSDELEFMAPGNLIESVTQLPIFFNNTTQDAPGGFFGTPGSGSLNIRGLNTNRTLTLLNGRRMTPSNRIGAVDIMENYLRYLRNVVSEAAGGHLRTDTPDHRLAGVDGVQGAHHQVARFRRSDGRRRRLQVSHFADQHYVWILAQDVFQGAFEIRRVCANLPLVDDTALVRMKVLDRVFNRDDMFLTVPIDDVDHRSESGTLSRTGRARPPIVVRPRRWPVGSDARP
mgnify:CR=1 FL=1